MEEIGGYFELELHNGELYHKNGVYLNSGRSSFALILKHNNIKKVFLPAYSCVDLLEPLEKMEIEYSLFHIKEDFSPKMDFHSLKPDQAVLLIDYFGCCEHVIDKYQNEPQFIFDLTQSFYSKKNGGLGSFYSPRKFFGVPDGGIAVSNNQLDPPAEREESINKFKHLLGRIEESGEAYHSIFKENEGKLAYDKAKLISNISLKILKSINYKRVQAKRTENFERYHEQFAEINELKPKKGVSVPLCYPLLIKNGNSLRKSLIENKIYTPTYWPKFPCLVKSSTFEYRLYNDLVALPVDQRYSEHEITYVIKKIKENI